MNEAVSLEERDYLQLVNNQLADCSALSWSPKFAYFGPRHSPYYNYLCRTPDM